MRILYGIVGEGMGHATRSRVVIEHLLAGGHTVRAVVSGRAYGFLSRKFEGRPRIRVEEIHGLVLGFEGNAIDKSETFLENLQALPLGLVKNIEAYRRLAEDDFEPELVISDFETWAYLYGMNHRLPIVSIDNMQVLNRCAHPDEVTESRSPAFRLARGIVKSKMPGAWHYVVTSFFFPRVRKKRTTLVPPILRPEILAAKREPGAHVLVYQTQSANEALLPVLRALPFPDVDFGEDAGWAELALERGHELAFEPKAVVLHAHRYDARTAWRRWRQDAAFQREAFGRRVRPGLGSALRGLVFELRRDWNFLRREGGLGLLPRALVLRTAQVGGAWAGSRGRIGPSSVASGARAGAE